LTGIYNLAAESTSFSRFLAAFLHFFPRHAVFLIGTLNPRQSAHADYRFAWVFFCASA
jgi:hypothetical protein